MSLLQGLIAGIVQGITSLIPVSSSAHAVLLKNIFGEQDQISLGYLSALHVGTLIAVVFVYRKDLRRLFFSFIGILLDLFTNLKILIMGKGRPAHAEYHRTLCDSYRRLDFLFIISMIPTLVIGYILRGISGIVAGNLLATGMGLFMTALMLFISCFSRKKGKTPLSTTAGEALFIGTLQGISVIPGISRLGMVISGASICGFTRKYMVRYAYLLSVPSIVGALIFELRISGFSQIQAAEVPSCMIGIIASALTGILVIRAISGLLSKKRNSLFAGYCFIVGIVSIAVYFH